MFLSDFTCNSLKTLVYGIVFATLLEVQGDTSKMINLCFKQVLTIFSYVLERSGRVLSGLVHLFTLWRTLWVFIQAQVALLWPKFKSSDSQSSALVTPYPQRVTFLFYFLSFCTCFLIFLLSHTTLQFNTNFDWQVRFLSCKPMSIPLYPNRYKSRSLLAEISRSLFVAAEVLVNLEYKWKTV